VVETNGVSAGVASTNALNIGSPPVSFANINQAAAAIAGTNNLMLGRNSTAAGIIYVKNGEHLWTGGSASVGIPNQTWLEVTAYPGTDRNNVIFTNTSGSVGIGGMVKLSQVKLASTAAIHFNNLTNLWFDQCVIDSSGAALIYGNTTWSTTGCFITNLAHGLAPYSTQNSPPALLRGNETGKGFTIQTYTVIGNSMMGNNLTRDFYDGATIPPSTNLIYFSNRNFLGGTAISVGLSVATNFNGAVVANNVNELTNSVSVPIFSLWADSNTKASRNVLFWHNTFAGNRINVNYNDTGSAAVDRVGWSLFGNLGDDSNIKSDTFPTADAARIGNWASLFGTGLAGNHFAQVTGIGAAGFQFEFPGLNSFERDGNTPDYVRFVSRKSYNGSTIDTGFGDYRVKSDSPVFRLQSPWVLSHDLEGNPRSAIDPAGAYSSGNVKKGAFF
jgi:hypothetical protein